MSEGWAEGPVQHPGRPWSGGGREELANEVRRLINATVTSAADPEVLARATAAVRAAADDLETHNPPPDEVPKGRFAEDGIPREGAAAMMAAMPFDVVVGSCNPLAPPVTLEFEPPGASAHAVFTAAHEGAPGCVHGAMIAAAFDVVLTAANVVAGAAGPTRSLTIRYRRPTLVHTESRFEAEVTKREGRDIHSTGRLIQNGVVTVEADGVFVTLDRPLIASMHQRQQGRKGAAPAEAGGEDQGAATEAGG